MRLKSSPLRGPFILMSWDWWTHSHFIFSILSKSDLQILLFPDTQGFGRPRVFTSLQSTNRAGSAAEESFRKELPSCSLVNSFPFGLLFPCHPLCFPRVLHVYPAVPGLSCSSNMFPSPIKPQLRQNHDSLCWVSPPPFSTCTWEGNVGKRVLRESSAKPR